MKRHSALAICIFLSTFTTIATAQSAREILDASGIDGGLIVHVGCGDGSLTIGLRTRDSYLVEGLDADEANVERTRKLIREKGLAGRVFADRLTGGCLPYVDNLIALLVSEDLGNISTDELMRVLRPGGVAYVKSRGNWSRTVKPRPKELDDWTHNLHDASNNPVSHDTVVGPPHCLQWKAAPTWSRHHHTLASISSVVSAGERLFYILDEGPADDMRVPGRWSVVARDAFSGVFLWKRSIPSWAYHAKRFRAGPVQLPRTIVASGDKVYVPLGMSKPVSALDAATGKIVKTYENTKGAEELILHDGILLVVTGSPEAEQAAVDPAWQGRAKYPNEKTIVAVQAGNGEELWRWSREGQGPGPVTLAAWRDQVFFQLGGGAACLDLNSGKELWDTSATNRPVDPPEEKKQPDKKTQRGKGKEPRKKPSMTARSVGWSVDTLVVQDGVVLLSSARTLTAMAADSGKILWTCPSSPGLCRSPSDVLVLQGEDRKLVYLGPEFSEGRDLHTGEIVLLNTIRAELKTAGHHDRCYRQKATNRYILTAKRGIELLDVVGNNHSRNNWVRGTCQYGVMPCNGLIYAPPHACGCYMESKLFGFYALAPKQAKKQPKPKVEDDDRLVKGPAYGKPADVGPSRGAPWTTYRGDAARSGATEDSLPDSLEPCWRVELGGPDSPVGKVPGYTVAGKLTQPVVASGRVVVSAVEANTVYALDAESGKRAWTFMPGGRVDSSPTIHREQVLFGCADGQVYCLRLSDGVLVWKFFAAPADRKTIVLDQVESVWPVHGSVLVQDDVAYFAAGRSSWLDGGIMLYAVEPVSGRILHKSQYRTDHPKFREGKDDDVEKYATKFAQNATDYKTFKASDRSDGFSMAEGAATDVMVGDGRSVFMKHLRFDKNLVRQRKMMPHLFSTSRLIDGVENHRSHWVFGTGDFSRMSVAYSWITYKGNRGWNLMVPHGILLTFDDETVWGVRRHHLSKWQIDNRGRYLLFAESRPKPSQGEKHLRDFRQNQGETFPMFAWTAAMPIRPRAMVKAGGRLVVAGTTDQFDEEDPYAVYEGGKGGILCLLSAADGENLFECPIDSPPVWDGVSIAGGKVYVSSIDGSVTCWGR